MKIINGGTGKHRDRGNSGTETQSHGRKRKPRPKHKKRRQTLSETLNRHFMMASIVCMALVGIFAAYLAGEINGKKQAATAFTAAPDNLDEPPELVKFDPEDAEAAAALQNVIDKFADNDSAAALAALEQVDTKYHSSPWYLDARTRAKFAADDLLGALADAQELAETAGSMDAYVLLSRIRYQGGDVDRAISLAEEAVRLEPLNWEAHYRLAEILRDEGQLSEGLASLHKAQQLVWQDWVQPIVDTKWQLAQLEAGTLKVEWADVAAADDGVSGEQLMVAGLAAAMDDDRAQAAALLARAKGTLASAQFKYYVSDPAFDLYRMDSGLAQLLTINDAPDP